MSDKEVDVLKDESKFKPQIGKSRQARAIFGKAVVYQKRQMFTNICCISLCPLMMSALAGILGSLILSLITKSTPVNEYVYCSNKPAMNEINIPFWDPTNVNYTTVPGNSLPGTTLDTVYEVNWALILGQLSTTQGPGAAASTFKRPCTWWYGEDYPFSKIYERPPNATGNLVRDSSFLSEPYGGWITALHNGGSLIENRTNTIFTNSQLRAWALISADPSVDRSLIGVRPQAKGFAATQLLAAPNQSVVFDPVTSGNNGGLLQTIPTRYYFDALADPSIQFQPIPWFNLSSSSDDDLDVMIGDAIRTSIAKVAQIDKSDLLSTDLAKQNEVFLKINEVLKGLPHGAIYFNKIDHSNKKYSWNYHFGTDIRFSSASSFPQPGPRLLYQQTQLDNAILRNANPEKFGNAQITQGFRILPQVGNTALNFPFGSLIGAILYPFGISFLLPIFAITLVQEKESRILVMMKMNGMKAWAHYLGHYITMFLLYTISTLIFIISGYYFKLNFFTITQPSVLFVLFFIWGNIQIAMAFLFSTLFNKSRTALVVVFLIVLCSVIISLVINNLFLDKDAPLAIFIWPPFAFYRALGLINSISIDITQAGYKFKDFFGNNEVAHATQFLFVEIFVVFGLAAYFDAVVPSEFGVAKPWHFLVTDLFSKKKSEQEILAELDAIKVDEEETKFEDSDVKEERARVLSPKFVGEDHLLIMKHMRKIYAGRGGSGPKLAVKDVTLAVEKGIIFGLLGPNGAGKSTLISILTGLYNASAGEASIAGYDIVNETSEVYKTIGICPQFDILWDELTVEEHLYFYARMKGISSSDEKRVVEDALREVALTEFRGYLSKSLSGGQKRRISIAIALIGAPQVIFLDEPTTGLDPEVRRLIWNIVNDAREGKTVILTTHSMEEAEALCQRIGIMAKGTLRCIANPTRLKELYGNGFKIFSNSEAENTPKVAAFLESILPEGWENVDSYATSISYEFPAAKGAIAKLFEQIEKKKNEIGILDYGIGQTTLEEVFVKLISESDASAEY